MPETEMNAITDIIRKLEKLHTADDIELALLLTAGGLDASNTNDSCPVNTLLAEAADRVRRQVYGTEVYLRGLIEFTNYCKNNCYYCGIRLGNTTAVRYRLTREEILACCAEGYRLGFRTFVLQGGEDLYYTDTHICDIIREIHKQYPDCAITLSVGEKPRDSYQAYYDAGAERYLLRHETATDAHYRLLHPPELTLFNRKRCLYDLKDIGYQTGAGFMVGSPYQTTEHLIADLRFLQELQPDMIGIGPYITHACTPFHTQPNGSLILTLRLLSILRLMFPHALLPATTALATIHPQGRILGLRAGANVIMPNLSPANVRALYELYENKIHTGEEAAECHKQLAESIRRAGYTIVTGRGDVRRPPR